MSSDVEQSLETLILDDEEDIISYYSSQTISDDPLSYGQSIWGTRSARGSFSKSHRPNPPSGYICKICGVPGHWIQQCPEQHNHPKVSYWKIKPPPEGYICRLCGVPGHWIQKCPIAPKFPDQYLEDEYPEEFFKSSIPITTTTTQQYSTPSQQYSVPSQHPYQKSIFIPPTSPQSDSLHANTEPWMSPFSLEKQDAWSSQSTSHQQPQHDILESISKSKDFRQNSDFATNPFQLGTLFDPSYLDLEDSHILTMLNTESLDERSISLLFQSLTRENVQVQMLKDIYGNSLGQARISFANSNIAHKVYRSLNNQLIPGTDQKIELVRDGLWSNRLSSGQKLEVSWSLADHEREKQREREKETTYSIFVGNLPLNIDRTTLFHTFHDKYPSVTCARVMHDTASGVSKGYGFVIFSDEKEQQRAMHEMQGQYCGERPMRLNTAKRKTL